MQYGKIKCEILSHAFLYFEMKKSSMPLVWVCAHTSKPSGYNSFKISSHRKCWKQTSFAWIHWPIFLKEILPLGFYLHWNRYKQSSIVSSQNLEDYPSSCTTDLLHKKITGIHGLKGTQVNYGTFWNKELCCFSCIRTNLDVKHFFAFPCIFANMAFRMTFFT